MKLNEVAETNEPIVLVFGRLCSGKGTFCKPYEQQGYAHVTTSDIVKRVSGKTKRGDLQHTKNLDSLIIDEMIGVIKQHPKIIIDGIRQRSIVRSIITEFGQSNIKLIWLEVPSDIRRDRFTKRSRDTDDQQFDDAEAGDSALGLDDLETDIRDKSTIINHY